MNYTQNYRMHGYTAKCFNAVTCRLAIYNVTEQITQENSLEEYNIKEHLNICIFISLHSWTNYVILWESRCFPTHHI